MRGVTDIKKYHLPAILTVILCYFGLFLIFFAWSHFSGYSGPLASRGVLDLSHWNFEQKGTVQLNGEWTFYPGQLLTSKSISEHQGKNRMYIPVPENAQSLENLKVYDLDNGTYRLLIRTSRDQEIFGLQTSVIYSSNRIYMNGRLVAQTGNVASGNDHQASLKPSVSYFPLHRGVNELVIQVSRAGGNTGWGIAKPLTFGLQSQISRTHDLILFNDMSMVIAFFIMGMYFFGYFAQRRKDLYLLFFSIICLLFSVIISWISDGRVIYLIWPSLSLHLLTWIESLSTLSEGMAIILCIYFSYPSLRSKSIVITIGAVSLLTLSGDFSTVPAVISATMILHSLLAVSVLIYTSYIFVLAIIKKVESSVYLIIASLAASVFVIVTTINSFTSKLLFSVYSPSSLIFLLMLSLMLSQRFSNAFRRNEQLARELVRNDHLKDAFIARTSLEFRTPLNGIINIVQTMLSEAETSPKSVQDEKDKLYLITRIGYRLSSLVNDILDLEKIKQGSLDIKPVPLDVYSCIRSELAYYELLASKKGLTVENNVPENLPMIFADENRFRQIINNLVDNAIKYTQHGKIMISAKPAGQGLEIMVTDTGAGIPKSEFQNIFKAFERHDALNQSEGAGLGLSIVSQLVELQHGRIWVDSEVGVGSVFHVILPLFDEKKGVAAGSAVRLPKRIPVSQLAESETESEFKTPYYSRQVHAATILVVDDNTDNLKVLIDMLEGIPYNVIAVQNGREALDEVARMPIDLVILDLMMPGMSGYDVCKKIRESHSLTDLPVLMLTAAIINDDKHFAFRAGANDILQKPYNFSEFSSRIRGLILMKKAASQAANMEVAFLQSQIRPHFLYNVLNSIIALSYEDVEKSREMTAQFASYLRSSFDFQNTSEMSTFSKEIKLVKSYLAIEKMRFEDRIQVAFAIDPDLDFPLPPLMIQPLVENAVLHGIGKQKSGGKVTVSARRSGNDCAISVSDNGIGMSEAQIARLISGKTGESVGLKNINSRLKHFYGSQLTIDSKPGKGTTFSMQIPLS